MLPHDICKGRGKNITVDAIRERLGTGSRTTLAEHLKRWKSLQADGEGKLPQPLLSLVSGLWDSLKSLSEKRIEENRSVAHEEIDALKSQLQTALQNEAALLTRMSSITRKIVSVHIPHYIC